MLYGRIYSYKIIEKAKKVIGLFIKRQWNIREVGNWLWYSEQSWDSKAVGLWPVWNVVDCRGDRANYDSVSIT